MAKAAIVIPAGPDGASSANARVVNGPEAAEEFAENDEDELELTFDGAATRWIAELEAEEHDYHDLYTAVSGNASACDHCAGAFGVDDAVQETDIVRLDGCEGHPSIRSLVDGDYEIVTF